MRTQKMSLANIQGKLSRAEMKNIMAGDAPLLEFHVFAQMATVQVLLIVHIAFLLSVVPMGE